MPAVRLLITGFFPCLSSVGEGDFRAVRKQGIQAVLHRRGRGLKPAANHRLRQRHQGDEGREPAKAVTSGQRLGSDYFM